MTRPAGLRPVLPDDPNAQLTVPRPVYRPRRKKRVSLTDSIRKVTRGLGLPRLRPGRWLPIAAVAGAFFATIGISLTVALAIRATRAADTFNPFQEDYGGPTATPNATPNPTFQAPTPQAYEGTERVTVLVMGVDTRPEERGYRTRTDTMILMSIDPATKRATMLSIPRDMYVDVPGHGLQRINTAYVYGGADLAVYTVQYNLGVRVTDYAVVEFGAFIRLVDEIGGIDLWVPVDIYDPTYPDQEYGYDPFAMPAGQQHMDGATALKYARTRHQDNDFERARRQQAVILAIRDKILSFDMLPTLIEKAPTLYGTLGESIRTNMTLEQMIALATLASEVPDENIRSGVIDADYLMAYETPEGAQVAIPDRAAIGPYIEFLFWLTE